MAVLRFSGMHVLGSGRPGAFRTLGGTLIPRGTPGVKFEPELSRKSETANLDAVKMQHNEAVAAFDATKHTSIHITNNTSHIERLNEGWSQQTSAGFFERALQTAKKAVVGAWKLKEVA